MSGEHGSVGEDFFSAWCSLGGMTANRSQRDVWGWDFIVQFDEPPYSGPLDASPPNSTVMVQVKTIYSSSQSNVDRSIDISLSNWSRMVKDNRPWFVVVVVLGDATKQPVECFVVHIGKSYIAKVMERLAQCSKGTMLHKKTLAVSWLDDDAVWPVDGKNLRSRIENCIGQDIRAYQKEKATHAETVGLEGVECKVTVGPRKDLGKEIADFAVGLIKELPVSSIVISQKRFGVRRVIKESQTGGLISFSSPPKLGHVTIKIARKDLTDYVKLTGDAFVASFVMPLPASADDKSRFSFRYMDLFLMPNRRGKVVMTIKYKVHQEGDAPLQVTDLHAAGKAGRFFVNSKKNPIFVEVERGLAVKTTIDEKFSEGRFDDKFSSAAWIFESVGEVAARLGIISTANIYASQIDRNWEKFSLAGHSFGDMVGSVITFKVSKKVSTGKQVHVLLGLSLPFDSDIVLLVFEYFGSSRWLPKTKDRFVLEITIASSSLFSKHIVPKETWSDEKFRINFVEKIEKRIMKTSTNGDCFIGFAFYGGADC